MARRSVCLLSALVCLTLAGTAASAADAPVVVADGHGARHGSLSVPNASAVSLNLAPGPQPDGGRAVAHRAGGIPVNDPGVLAAAPEARLYATGVTAAEPTLGIGDDGTILVVQAVEGIPTLQAPVLRSRDQGLSWQEVSPRIGPTNRHPITLDPYIYLDEDTGRVFTADIDAFVCAFVSFSDNQGDGWTTSQACGVTDHQTVFSGKPTSAVPTIGYPKVVYYCAMDGGALAGFATATSCLRSRDGGLTWTKTLTPAYRDDPTLPPAILGLPGHCGGGTGHGIADRNGTIYLPRGYCDRPFVAISRDEGDTWTRVQVADTGMPYDPGGQIQDHEAGIASDDLGNLYYVWTGRNRLPYLAISRNGGTNWSAPVMVGPPGLKEATLPSIDVETPGKVALSYIGSTNAPGGAAPKGYGDDYPNTVTWNGYITISTNVLSDDPLFYTGSVNPADDPLVRGSCPVLRCAQQFDFIDVQIAPDGTPWASMADGCPPGATSCRDFLGAGVLGRLVNGPSLLAGPEPVVPEVATPVLLPLLAALGMLGVHLVRRRSHRRPAPV